MVKVRLFAAAAEAVQRRELEGSWAGKTVGEVLEELKAQHPSLGALIPSLATAVNREYVSADRVLQDGDELALIPPVSGGAEAEPPLFEVTTAPLSADEVAARVTNNRSGATVVFVGTVREWTDGRRTVALEYDAYPEMAVEQMRRIGEEIASRWPGARTAIVHRIGRLEPTEASVVIAVSAPHRAEAFEACRHAIERLKQTVTIWKKEIREDGSEWIGS
ncbi:MAG TPA: molybdenum cofactor biosynthesis protein MoaE [Symbiobacteriaceae bacterium]